MTMKQPPKDKKRFETEEWDDSAWKTIEDEDAWDTEDDALEDDEWDDEKYQEWFNRVRHDEYEENV